MCEHADVLAVIPARGGSSRVPLKNITSVAGRPSLAHAVDALREATMPLRTVLLTDHSRIADVGRGLGLDVVDEPADLADDDSIDETKLLRLALEWAETTNGRFQFVLLHYACVPVRPRGVVDGLIQLLQQTGADFVQTAAPASPHQHAYRLVTRTSDGRMAEFVPNSAQVMSQDYPPLYFRTAAGVGMRRDAVVGPSGASFFNPQQPLDRRCLIHDADDCVDIDEPRDILWAEFLLQQRRHLAFSRNPAALPTGHDAVSTRC